MIGVRKVGTVLVATVGALALASCGGGGSSVVSPGEGAFATGGTGGTGGAGGGSGGNGQASSDCPTGFINLGTVANGTLRSCGIPQLVTSNLTVPFRPGTAYRIDGRVAVGEDQGSDSQAPRAGARSAVLTIEPGVTVFGGISEFLVVNRGSRIVADGTASRPIIFTSLNDLNGGPDLRGQWGGIVIAGRAPINRCPPTTTAFPANPTACEFRFEAIQTINWGGNAPTESSGTLRYVQVKEAGFEVAPNEELNGITFGGVGNGTIVDFVQVHGSADDAVEFFGGTVNVRHLVLTQWDDDGYDTDEGYTGSAQYVINYTDAPTEESRCFEMSSAGSTSGGAPLLRSNPRVSNFVCRLGLAGTAFDSRQHQGILMNSGTRADFLNGLVVSENTRIPCLDIDGASTMVEPRPAFRSVVFACVGGPYRTTDGDQDAAPEALMTVAGSNNLATGYIPTLTQVFINGGNESGRVATNPTTFSSFFLATNFIGAVSGPNDTWFVGWTCGLAGATSC
ncbi:hypothetical protein [Phenylobacterium sp.]|uniref:hypothetical protein n=1 Tax=Phenylobacterium sp. TaxID=1871053 RepID=UPI0037CB87C9